MKNHCRIVKVFPIVCGLFSTIYPLRYSIFPNHK